jgi:hypothetical protein
VTAPCVRLPGCFEKRRFSPMRSFRRLSPRLAWPADARWLGR